MITVKKSKFDEVTEFLGELQRHFQDVPQGIKNNAAEIRLRASRPIIIECGSTRHIISHNVTFLEISECIKRFCGYSVYSHSKELSEGYITLKGGHRAGFCGSAVIKNGQVEAIKDISGINIRIAKEYVGCSDTIFSYIKDFKGILIVGVPLSGKTTVLRDIARNLGSIKRVSVIDERCEIAAMWCGVPQNNIGINTDVLSGFPKDVGFETALRSMSPEIIICDEIGSDYKSIMRCFNSGVKVILSAHFSDLDELISNNSAKEILLSGAISDIVFLNPLNCSARIKEIWHKNKEVKSYENSYSNSGGGFRVNDWSLLFSSDEKKDGAFKKACFND